MNIIYPKGNLQKARHRFLAKLCAEVTFELVVSRLGVEGTAVVGDAGDGRRRPTLRDSLATAKTSQYQCHKNVS